MPITGPFVALSSRALAHPAITKTDLLVLLALCAHADYTTNECFPSGERIAEVARLDRKSVYPALQHLAELGFIRRVADPRTAKGNYTAARYRVVYDAPDAEVAAHLALLPSTENGSRPWPENGTPPSTENGSLTRSQSNEEQPTTPLPVQVETALQPYLATARYLPAIRASVAMLLNPEASPHYEAAEVARALTEMQAANRPFNAGTLTRWCSRNRENPPMKLTSTDPFPPGKWARLAAELRKEGAA